MPEIRNGYWPTHPHPKVRVEEVLQLTENSITGFPVGLSVAATTEGLPEKPGIVVFRKQFQGSDIWSFIPDTRILQVLEVAEEMERNYRTREQSRFDQGARDFVSIKVGNVIHSMDAVIWDSMQSLTGLVPDLSTRIPMRHAIRDLDINNYASLYKQGHRLAAVYERQALGQQIPNILGI